MPGNGRKRQAAAAERYNKTAQPKSELVDGQTVRLYSKEKRSWEPAVVTGHGGTPRSYVVQRLAGGVPLRRNRIHLRPTSEVFPDAIQTTDVDDEEEEVVHGTTFQCWC